MQLFLLTRKSKNSTRKEEDWSKIASPFVFDLPDFEINNTIYEVKPARRNRVSRRSSFDPERLQPLLERTDCWKSQLNFFLFLNKFWPIVIPTFFLEKIAWGNKRVGTTRVRKFR